MRYPGFNARWLENAMDRDRYGPVFMRAARYIARVYNKHLARVSLTASQHVILDAVGQSGPIALQGLADTLVIERSALHRTLQPLKQARFIETIPDAVDKRRPLYQLTDEGKALLALSATHICLAEAEIEGFFNESEISTIRGSLLPVVNALGSFSD
jgi:DNA-binding MarR family transcriptional regulator